MARFRITVTEREEEWSSDNQPLQCIARTAGRAGLQCAVPAPGVERGAAPQSTPGDTPGYGREVALQCAPAFDPERAVQSTLDMPGYGEARAGSLSPLAD